MSRPATYPPKLRADLVSGFLVFLIALPLSLGIAMASGFPPVAGIVTAVVGGLLATWVGSAQLTIKGPAAGLIVIAIGAVQELGGGNAMAGYHRALAAIVVAGALQIGLALARAGALGDFFPASVVHGMLAAIGVIIMSKQAHTALGVAPQGKNPLELLAEIPHSLANLNPEVALIGGVSLALLFTLPKLPFSWAKKVPAPMLVLVTAMGLGALLDLSHEHTYSFHLHSYVVGPKYLVQLPGNIAAALSRPDFSQLFSLASIKYIVMFTLVGSLESLLSAKAVDALDPQRRQSNLDHDLLATGIGNVIAGLLGGLPMISEIVRSSANINNGAQSRLANFFHGLFLLLMVVLAPGLLQRIPLSALGAMLIYTGFRLASPREFLRALRIGREQLVVFVTTLLFTLATDLLLGVLAGIVVKLGLHLKNGAPLSRLFRSQVDVEVRPDDGGHAELTVHGAAVFSNYLGLLRCLQHIPGEVKHVVIDLRDTRLVDHTVVEKLHHLGDDYQRAGRRLEIRGLQDHQPLARHKLAARRKIALAS